MVVVMRPGTEQREIDKLVAQFQLQGLQRPLLASSATCMYMAYIQTYF